MNPLKFSLDIEINGARIYLDLAVKTENLLAKKLFYYLAMEEIKHAERFDEIYGEIMAGEKSGVGIKREPDIEKDLKIFFKESDKASLKAGSENISGYEMAIKLEKKSYIAYEKFRNAAKSGAEKEFFSQLMKEEESHYDALANVYYYLTGNGDWLQEDESRVWNWMNM